MIFNQYSVQSLLLENNRNATLERMFRGILDNLYASGHLTCKSDRVEVINSRSNNNTPMFVINTEFLDT